MAAGRSPLLTTREAAAYCRLGLHKFRAAVARGEVARIDHGGHPTFLLDDLEAFLARRRVPAAWERRDPARRRIAPLFAPGEVNPVSGRVAR